MFGYRFHYNQNILRKKGGPIGFPKLYWLSWTIFIWFLLPVPLFLWQEMPMGLWAPYMFIALSFWIRGIIEMYMLYVAHNWIPPYGMTHDLVTFFCALFFCFKYDSWSMEIVPLLFISTILISLLVETYYAFAFYQIMKGKTTGEDGEWFAHWGDPKYTRILIITSIGNWLLTLGVLPYFISLFR